MPKPKHIRKIKYKKDAREIIKEIPPNRSIRLAYYLNDDLVDYRKKLSNICGRLYLYEAIFERGGEIPSYETSSMISIDDATKGLFKDKDLFNHQIDLCYKIQKLTGVDLWSYFFWYFSIDC